MKRPISQAIIFGFILALLAPIALAATFSFSPSPLGTVFSIPERSNFSYDLNSSVNDSLLRFSQQQTNLSTLQINNATGMITYTPPSLDIGYHSDGVIFIAENQSDSLDFITTKVFFNITNVNDAPNASSYSPSSFSPSMTENSTLLFNITATDSDLSYGDTINISWYIDSGLVQTILSNETINSTLNFTTGFCNASVYNVTAIITDSSNSTNVLTWMLTVTNVNRAPVFNRTISNISWFEDTNLTDNLTLSDYFYDLDSMQCVGTNRDNLTYISNISINTPTVNVSIHSNTSNTSFYPHLNFAGNISIFFTAMDAYSNTTSNAVLLTVNNTADAPNISNLTNMTAPVNVLFTRFINATDPDVEYGDNLTWYTNSTIFNITKFNSTYSVINFTPTNGQIGVYSVLISVNDSTNLTAFGVISFAIQNNTAPAFLHISDQNSTQGSLFRMNVSAYDFDDDNMTFSTNSTLFSISAYNTSMGVVEFTPSNSDIGNYTFLFTVTDSKGATDSQAINFSVYNTNDAPTLDLLSSPVFVKVNRTLLLSVGGADIDIQWGDILTFYTNNSLFNMTNVSSISALLNFTPSYDDVGNHSVLFSVRDAQFANASQAIVIVVTNSTLPVITFIGNHSVSEDSLINITINVTDLDGDAINFTINQTLLNITNFTFSNLSSTRSFLAGTPAQEDVGVYTFQVNATDPDGHISIEYFDLTVTYTDDRPILQSIPNQSVSQDSNYLYNFTAYDEEIVSFGTPLNLTFYSNSTLYGFNFTQRINSTSMLVNFTPSNLQVGVYSINITVSDSNSNDSLVFVLNVTNVNDAPSIADYLPLNSTPVIAENSSLIFSANASDTDFAYGDNLSVSWYLDSVNQTSGIIRAYGAENVSSTWNFNPSFCIAGYHNVTAVFKDSSNSTASVYWNVSVGNVNRLPEFGVKRHTLQSDFLSGTFSNASGYNSTGNVTLFEFSAQNYSATGTFTSALIDFGSKFRFSSDINVTYLQRIEMDSIAPENTSISLQYRTSLDGSDFTNWSDETNITPIIPDQHTVRYLQYRINLYSNTGTNLTPTLQEVRVRYTIANISIIQNTRYTGIIDLADYLVDPDRAECSGANQDSLAMSVQGNSSILMSFSSSSITLLEISDFTGTETLYFTANDTYNLTLSDPVVFTVVPNVGGSIPSSSSSSSSSSGGGGSSGSSTQIQTKIVIKNITKPISLNIITPKPLVVYNNDTVSVPITLTNRENFSLSDIHMSASLPNSSITYSYSLDYIEELAPGESIDTLLTLNAFRNAGTYEVVINANVSNPEYIGTASFFVSSIELGSFNQSQFNTRITFARDLVTSNPSCLELEEQLRLAQAAAERNDYAAAEKILVQTISDCKYLLSLNGAVPEQPGQILLQDRLVRLLRNVWVMGAVITFGILLAGLIIYRFLQKTALSERKYSPEEEEIAAILGLKKK